MPPLLGASRPWSLARLALGILLLTSLRDTSSSAGGASVGRGSGRAFAKLGGLVVTEAVILEASLLGGLLDEEHPRPSADSSTHGGHKGISRSFWWIGILATLVGATLTVLGLMVQKSSHKQHEDTERFYWMEWRWLLGLAVWLVGQLLCWAADGLANRSLLACFNCWNIVVVLVLAPACLGEAVGRAALAGAGVTVLGCIWVLLAGPKAYHQQTVESLQEEWVSPAFLAVAGLSGLGAAALLARAWAARRKFSLEVLSAHQLAALSAVFAWYAVLLSKCSSSLVVTSLHARRSQLGHWQFWLFPFGTLLFAVAQMHTLNLALKVGSALSVVPVYEALSMTGQVVICGFFFDEFRGFGFGGLAAFWCGVICVLSGVAMLICAGLPPGCCGSESQCLRSL